MSPRRTGAKGVGTGRRGRRQRGGGGDAGASGGRQVQQPGGGAGDLRIGLQGCRVQRRPDGLVDRRWRGRRGRRRRGHGAQAQRTGIARRLDELVVLRGQALPVDRVAAGAGSRRGVGGEAQRAAGRRGQGLAADEAADRAAQRGDRADRAVDQVGDVAQRGRRDAGAERRDHQQVVAGIRAAEAQAGERHRLVRADVLVGKGPRGLALQADRIAGKGRDDGRARQRGERAGVIDLAVGRQARDLQRGPA